MGDAFALLGVLLVRLFAHVSIRGRQRFAAVLAWVFWRAVPSRRHVTLTNLRLCFPDKTDGERLALARDVYRRHARAVLDHGVLWVGTAEDVLKLVKFDGLEKVLDTHNRPLIVLTPHFVGLDAAGIAFTVHIPGLGLYQRQRNRVWDRAIYEGRMRFNESVLFAKGSGAEIRSIIRLMREGLPLYYLPDMDFGRRGAVFVPFFGVPAATREGASRLAKMTGARVILCVTEMTDEGYVVHLSDVWENFPSGDALADTVRVNREIESWIRKLPDQYLWTHRRFKTRPEGEPSVY